MSYWGERIAKAQNALTSKSTKAINKQLEKYYLTTMKQVISDFESTYNKLLVTIEKGKEPTPADLYKLDSYWKLQGDLKQKLMKLGNKQATLLSREFETQFFNIYNSFSLPSQKAYSTLSDSSVKQMINQIWCADGKSWSSRVWSNLDLLQETLNENLISCVSAGRTTKDLKKALQERFNVGYSRANALVRTEMAHIQTQAAQKRYEDYGLQYYEILGNEDGSCGNHSVDCHEMNGKRFLLTEMAAGVNAPPFHPNCKCCIVPVVE